MPTALKNNTLSIFLGGGGANGVYYLEDRESNTRYTSCTHLPVTPL